MLVKFTDKINCVIDAKNASLNREAFLFYSLSNKKSLCKEAFLFNQVHVIAGLNTEKSTQQQSIQLLLKGSIPRNYF